ncbi:uncharacterized protein LOC131162722 [Malania oleifera]|uniref:uncharacterized protein LOC131162722 n=1 Tax=Malania oleifera TaxID=397392 RepID=UPI0025AEAF41|nr:uncharacterized protein LOC131162722 [Malania oleifera]
MGRGGFHGGRAAPTCPRYGCRHPGATHSFVSAVYAKLTGYEAQLLDIGLAVATPIGSVMRCRIVLKELAEVMAIVRDGQAEEFSISDDGTLRFHTRLCVHVDTKIRRTILEEAHRSVYIVHPGSTTMYHDLRKYFWWSGMKRGIAEFV